MNFPKWLIWALIGTALIVGGVIIIRKRSKKLRDAKEANADAAAQISAGDIMGKIKTPDGVQALPAIAYPDGTVKINTTDGKSVTVGSVDVAPPAPAPVAVTSTGAVIASTPAPVITAAGGAGATVITPGGTAVKTGTGGAATTVIVGSHSLPSSTVTGVAAVYEKPAPIPPAPPLSGSTSGRTTTGGIKASADGSIKPTMGGAATGGKPPMGFAAMEADGYDYGNMSTNALRF